jgi:ABC-2 type transport system permease protein
MIRLWRIARREYISYVRTPGFWLSLVLMPVVATATMRIPAMMDQSTPPPRLVVVDLTHDHLGAAFAAALRDKSAGQPAALVVVPAPPDLAAAPSAAVADRRLKQRLAAGGAGFETAAVLSGADDAVKLDLWSGNLADGRFEALVKSALHDVLRTRRLTEAGVSEALVAQADRIDPEVNLYSPRAAEAGKVSLRDRLPTVAGFGMGLLLWSVILTGAGILLNSVIEEKSSRILEVLLTSASVPEVMGGKILGVAGVSGTVLMVWAAAGSTALSMAAPGLGAEVWAALVGKGLIAYFAVFLVFGYLMYASIFAAIGAFCETTREAQTLLGPVMLVLTIPVIFMGQAIPHPNAPILQALTWFPPFTPFLMVARAASGPPAWQVAGAVALMMATTAVVLWLAGRAFRAGALSVGKLDYRALAAGLFGRAT